MLKGLRIGLGFGLASGAITTLGLIVGLVSSTGSKLAVIGGILTIAIADSFSDALGVHISKESEGGSTEKEIWQATFFTFFFKAVFASTFIIPVLLLPLWTALYVSISWAALILIIQSYELAKNNKTKPIKTIFEHLLIAVIVIFLTYFAGIFISRLGLA